MANTEIKIKADAQTISEIVDVYTEFMIGTFDSFNETGEEPEECNSTLVDANNITIIITDEHWANLWDVIDSYEFDAEIVELQKYNTINDTRTAFENSGIIEMLEYDKHDEFIEHAYRNNLPLTEETVNKWKA